MKALNYSYFKDSFKGFYYKIILSLLGVLFLFLPMAPPKKISSSALQKKTEKKL